jgi:hypothetical protein
MRKTLLALLAVPALAVAGCSAAGSATPAAPSQSATSAPAAHCRNPHGGACLNELDAGTYATSKFEPAITYTVPNGWTNDEDLPGNFLLHKTADSQVGVDGGSYVGIYQNVRAASITCAEMPQIGVRATPADLVAFYRTVPGLTVSEPTAVTVGGLEGLQIDLSVAAGEGLCSYDGLNATPVIIGGGVSALHHVVLAGLAMRLILLDWDGGNVTIEIVSVEAQHPAEEYRAEVQTILDALSFGEQEE